MFSKKKSKKQTEISLSVFYGFDLSYIKMCKIRRHPAQKHVKTFLFPE
ncbi:hypothetical protein CHCC20333_2661 [Bacillus paralicheniformis]|nr:hypothetical protein CHCC20333_2661 [Bacillus paralicheniformis]